jgi:alginate O-acetyltransferase complex protein AlgI
MLFTTGDFLFVYLPVVLALFFVIARWLGPPLAAGWIVLASFYFYGSWRPEHVVLLASSIAFNYSLGGLILRARTRGDEQGARRWMIFAVAADLAVLAYFKYADFLIDSVNAAFGRQLSDLHVALPLGISFFTFTQIAYLVDVQQGKAVERSPTRYALFVAYFPHLVAGPVLHHAQMMPQFRQPDVYRPQLRNCVMGMGFLLLGLVKKVLIADSFAPIANQLFEHAASGPVATALAWRGVLAYTLQIYFDFSGYSDMAVGLSRLFNIRLPYNFNSPYKALSIIDFWHRWHMTLSAFLRDYLYIALGGNRKGKTRRYVNLLATMLLGGLWHGASWTFVAWGGLHGFYLIINHGWRWLRSQLGWSAENSNALTLGAIHLAASVLTLVCVIVAWVFFRAGSFDAATRVLTSMAGFSASIVSPVAQAGDASQWLWLAVFLLVARLLPNSQEIIDGYGARLVDRKAASNAADALQAASIGFGMAMIVLLAVICESRNTTEFIYFNF